jgi:hypothetical protein
MMEHFIKSEARVRRVRASVIGPHVDSFTDCLTRLGFAVTTVRPKVTLHVSNSTRFSCDLDVAHGDRRNSGAASPARQTRAAVPADMNHGCPDVWS